MALATALTFYEISFLIMDVDLQPEPYGRKSFMKFATGY